MGREKRENEKLVRSQACLALALSTLCPCCVVCDCGDMPTDDDVLGCMCIYRWNTMKAKGTSTDINAVPEEGEENPAVAAIASLKDVSPLPL